MTDEKSRFAQEYLNMIPITNIPRDLSAALAADVRAMQIFSEMPDAPREAFIRGAASISDRGELRRYVSDIREEKK